MSQNKIKYLSDNNKELNTNNVKGSGLDSIRAMREYEGLLQQLFDHLRVPFPTNPERQDKYLESYAKLRNRLMYLGTQNLNKTENQVSIEIANVRRLAYNKDTKDNMPYGSR